MELEALQEQSILKSEPLGAQIVVLTAELERYTRALHKKLNLTFDILTDLHLVTADLTITHSGERSQRPTDRSSLLLEVRPPTGEPDAGNPPVRFGGRWSARSPYPYQRALRGTMNGDGKTSGKGGFRGLEAP